MADDPEGFDDAVTDTEGNPWVILALNVVLSSAFAATVVWGLSMLGFLAFTVWNVASLALVLTSVTYVVTR